MVPAWVTGTLEGGVAGGPASAELGHELPGMFPAPWVGPHGWNTLLPSSVLGARPAQKPPDVSRPARPLMGRKWAGALGTDEPARRTPRRHSQGDAGTTHPSAYGAGPGSACSRQEASGLLGVRVGRSRGVWPISALLNTAKDRLPGALAFRKGGHPRKHGLGCLWVSTVCAFGLLCKDV